jgi:hypothetical protein
MTHCFGEQEINTKGALPGSSRPEIDFQWFESWAEWFYVTELINTSSC